MSNDIEIVDGMAYDANTGELLGHAEYDGPEQEEPWVPETPEDADFLLERLSNLESELAAKQQQYEDILARKMQIIKRMENQAAGIRHHYLPALLKIAKENPDPRAQRMTRPFGTVGWKMQRPKVTIINKDAAEGWCERYAPSAITSQLVSKIDAKKLGDCIPPAGPPDQDKSGIKYLPPREEGYIK